MAIGMQWNRILCESVIWTTELAISVRIVPLISESLCQPFRFEPCQKSQFVLCHGSHDPQALCTKNKNGRFIERSIYQEALEENQKRVEENPEYNTLRQQITEYQLGTLKRQWGFTHTLMRGKQNVLSEANLIMICYNLTRLMAIVGS